MTWPASRSRGVLALLVVLAGAGCFERGGDDSARARAARSAAQREAEQAAPEPAAPVARDPAAAADPDATITVLLEAEPAHLSPFLAGDALASRVALGDVYEGLLCQPAPAAEPAPCLAEEVREDAGGTRFTFALRRGVAWHDGQEFGPADVLFTYGLVRGADAVPTGLAADFDDLLSVEATGERAVVMTFARFRPGRRQALARVPILPRHVFAGPRAGFLASPAHRTPVGTGPLRLVSWAPGQRIVLERFARYWGEPAAAARIDYRVIGERERALRAVAEGRIDVAVQLPVDEARAAVSERVRLFRYDQPAYLAAVYNARTPALADARARRALSLLIDRPSLARALFAGHARPVAGPYLDHDPDRDQALAPHPFDPGRARALLAEAGVAPGAELTVLVPAGSRTMARIADVWAADARALVTLRVDARPYADVLGRLRDGRFDIALMAFTTGLELDLLHRFHSRGSDNHGAIADAALDRALEAARAEPDPARRRALQRQVQARLAALEPYAFITSDTRVGLVRADIGGFENAAWGARRLWRAR